jgi:phosphoglycerate dehydrogenase-like enzyme
MAKLPDQGIIINTARGAIIDQVALFDELKSGRLRAGLDVLWPDNLPENHEARQWENLIWTCHQFSSIAWPSEGIAGELGHYQIHLENIKAFSEGKPLQFVIDEIRYLRMT